MFTRSLNGDRRPVRSRTCNSRAPVQVTYHDSDEGPLRCRTTCTFRPKGPGANPMNRLHEGFVLGERYRLERRIASGGMADVWEGSDDVLKRHVAIKIMRP